MRLSVRTPWRPAANRVSWKTTPSYIAPLFNGSLKLALRECSFVSIWMDKLDPCNRVTPISLEWRHNAQTHAGMGYTQSTHGHASVCAETQWQNAHTTLNDCARSNSWIIACLHVCTEECPLFFLYPSNCVANVSSTHINIITQTGLSSLYVFHLQDKSLPDELLTLCSWLQLSAAPPQSVAEDDNRRFNFSWDALITYLFFTWDGIHDTSEQYT